MKLVFDIGGTNMRFAVSRDGATFGEPKITRTPSDFATAMSVIGQLVTELSGGEKIDQVAGGIAGVLSKDKTILVTAPHLASWVKQPLAATLSEKIGTKVNLENDAAMVALGEATEGAGKGFGIVAYLTISTGVGGARVINQKLDEHTLGFEPGHQIIMPKGEYCPGCGGWGHLEAYVSGSAVQRKYGQPPEQLTDEAIWEELALYLAYGLNNTIVHWAPEVVVLGGSMMKEVGIPLARVQYHLEKTLTIYSELPKLVHGTLNDVGGLHGSLAYLNSL